MANGAFLPRCLETESLLGCFKNTHMKRAAFIELPLNREAPWEAVLLTQIDRRICKDAFYFVLFCRKDFLWKLSDLGSFSVAGGVFCPITWPLRTVVAMVELDMMWMFLAVWISIWLWNNLEVSNVSELDCADKLPGASHDTSLLGPVWAGPTLGYKSFMPWSLFMSTGLTTICPSLC